MGIRLHVAEVYQVKEHSRTYFNNQNADINQLLYKKCPELSFEGDAVECSERLEIPRCELANLIRKIVEDKEAFELWAKKHCLDVTADKMIGYIAEWSANSDQRNDFVVVIWH